MNCDDEDLKAELYSNRAMAFFCLGKDFYIYRVKTVLSLLIYLEGLQTSDLQSSDFGLKILDLRYQPFMIQVKPA